MSKRRRPSAPEPSPWVKRLADLRTHYGSDGKPLSQEQAAERLNVPVGTWRNWEQGRRRPNSAIVRLLELTFPAFFKKS